MALSPADRDRIEDRLGRTLTPAEAALFENLWSEHCAYRSSRPLLGQLDSEGDRVVIGPGDDAAVVALTDEWYLTLGIESHNHPSYVDPYDGAATGVGGIVRDTISMGAYPIALADCLYFGAFAAEHPKYLFEGVVEGIADYGNAIGVPTVTGSVQFHPGYEGNPLVNVACLGLVHADRLVTATATAPGNALVLIGNATGRDGLGGASFASEDLAEDAETADRPAVQVGDPFTEKLLIEANEALLDGDLVRSARDLGAAGLGGASSELVAKGELGAAIELDRVHQREPNMNALEILLAESQERMLYEVSPADVDAVRGVAERFELGCSVIGEVTDGPAYRCTFDGETVVDVPVSFLCEGAPMHDWPTDQPRAPDRELPDVDAAAAFETVVEHPNTASKAWVYRQYDHEVGVRTAAGPGRDAALLAVRETGNGVAIAAGADANWTVADPYRGASWVALEVATNLAVAGAEPLAAVDCLNGGNPETPTVYHDFGAVVDGLASTCAALEVPVVGGNVSLYNDSAAGPIPPTPTLAMAGVTPDYVTPSMTATGNGDLVLLGELTVGLGGSQLLATLGGTDDMPVPPADPLAIVETVRRVARLPSTQAIHDVSHGGIAVTAAEMVTDRHGLHLQLPGGVGMLCSELPGRVLVETTDPDALARHVGDAMAVSRIGRATNDGLLRIATTDGAIDESAGAIADRRNVIAGTLE